MSDPDNDPHELDELECDGCHKHISDCDCPDMNTPLVGDKW